MSDFQPKGNQWHIPQVHPETQRQRMSLAQNPASRSGTLNHLLSKTSFAGTSQTPVLLTSNVITGHW